LWKAGTLFGGSSPVLLPPPGAVAEYLWALRDGSLLAPLSSHRHMAAEIYVTILTGFGLGHLLHYGRELGAMDQVIGIMLVIIVIGLVTDKTLFAPWERFMHRRWGTGAVQ
jgi:ABC-type nitrate/sulfonate/bicarbonate transport system permease component